ncbi:MAG TPA: PstS family phosphate ABC transporter substrate-binding protein [Planctomycetota bacterium]|nr:PstS family phosphate ABC transporter substrate-binding protein [Planctomycetota bacterium]
MKIFPVSLAAAALLAGGCGSRGIMIKGSDTMSDVAQAWASRYHELHPEVKLTVQGGGTGTGVAALIDGSCDLANCSRVLEPEEIEKAKANHHDPVEHKVGHDAIAIYVHKDNPIASITMDQLKEIYGDKGKLAKWSELGVSLHGKDGRSITDDKIVLVSRQNNSGTYHYFQEYVLKKGNYRLGTMDQSGSKDVVEFVANNPSAIGYSGIAFANKDVKIVPVQKGSTAPVTPSIDSTLDGSYPIARPLFMYSLVGSRPEVQSYLDWIISDAGQRVLQDAGYPPLHKL